MEERKKKKKKHKHSDTKSSNATTDPPLFKPSPDVKGVRFGAGQFVVKSFTVRRATPLELASLLNISSSDERRQSIPLFPSATAYLPTSFTILAHHAWHTLTLGLGTRKSKVLLFVFESEGMKSAAERAWPAMIALGDVNRRLVRGLVGCEMARFKFRKGCVTFYVYAVRRAGASGFARADDLEAALRSVVELKEFLDHTAMLALPSQRSIGFSPPSPPVAMAH